MSDPARRRPSLRWTLAWQLLTIAVAVAAVNIVIVALDYGRDRDAVTIEAVRDTLAQLESTLVSVASDSGAADDGIPRVFDSHRDAYAFALLDANGSIVDGRNVGIIPAQMLEPGAFASDWVAWPNGPGVLPVAAAQTIGDDTLDQSLVFWMQADPRGLLSGVIASEFLDHVLLPIAPVSALLILGTLLILNHSLRPVADAARWARSIVPGRRVPPPPERSTSAEITDLTNAVSRSIARLDAELAAEQRRAAEAAHALRTPVAVLIARLETLPDLPEIEQLRRDVQSLSRMVTQVLSSSGADRLEIEEGQQADLNAVAEAVVAETTPWAFTRGVEVALDRADAPQTVKGSSDAIKLALTNLVENAVFHGSGTVTVTVGPGPELRVRDEGAGLQEDQFEDLLRPFKRGPDAAPGGAGLGLAIVDRVQRAHDGRFSVEPTSSGRTEIRLGYHAI